MAIKAVGFDIGGTLIRYNIPMNWSSHYDQALRKVLADCRIPVSEEKIASAGSILAKYNTRVTPREIEVDADTIFGEILKVWAVKPDLLQAAKRSFFSFFQQDARPFDEVPTVLRELKDWGIKTGILSDVAYGMDTNTALGDIDSIRSYIDIALTSVDIGFRKPHTAGFMRLLTALDVCPCEILFVGDEPKDIEDANRAGIGSVLIDRSELAPNLGQKYTISNLNQLFQIIDY